MIPGYTLDLDPACGVTMNGSSRVSQWNDQSGAGFNAVQATAGNQPLWTGPGVSVFGGWPSIQLQSASSYYMTLGAVIPNNNKTVPMSMFLVNKTITNGSPARFFNQITPASGLYAPHFSVGDSFNTDKWATNTDKAAVQNSQALDASTTTAGTPKIIGGVWDGTQFSCWTNGVFRNVTLLSVLPACTNNNNGWSIGCLLDGAGPTVTFPANTDIGRIIMFNTALSDYDMGRMFEYLNRLYRVY